MATRKVRHHGIAVHKPYMYPDGRPGPSSLCGTYLSEGIKSTVTDAEVTCGTCLRKLARIAARVAGEAGVS